MGDEYWGAFPERVYRVTDGNNLTNFTGFCLSHLQLGEMWFRVWWVDAEGRADD
jgi:hypothetical protein